MRASRRELSKQKESDQVGVRLPGRYGNGGTRFVRKRRGATVLITSTYHRSGRRDLPKHTGAVIKAEHIAFNNSL